jgi:hypothetical protein
MTAKTPDSPQESRPAAASSSSIPAQPSSVPAQSAEPPTVTTPAIAAPVPTQQAALPAAAPAKAAPAKSSKKAPGSTTRSASISLAYAVSVLAVLIALGSTVVALYALDVARQAKSRTADIAGVPAPTATGQVTPTVSSGPLPTPTRPRLQFVPESVRADLRIPPADGCASVFVDLDSMQVGVDNGHEFYLSNCTGSLALRIDRTSGAVPTQENPTPEVCVAQLAGATSNSELVLSVRTGLTFCLLTNKDEAARQGQPQRVGIVEVRQVNPDKSVTVAVSTYRVPE